MERAKGRVTLVMLMVGRLFASAMARFNLFSGTKSSFTSSMISPGTMLCTQKDLNLYNLHASRMQHLTTAQLLGSTKIEKFFTFTT